MVNCKICNQSIWNNNKKYCDDCDRKFREFIVLFTRLIEEILEFYFGNGEGN